MFIKLDNIVIRILNYRKYLYLYDSVKEYLQSIVQFTCSLNNNKK